MKDQGKLKARKAAEDATDKVATRTGAQITKILSDYSEKEAAAERKLAIEAESNSEIENKIEKQLESTKKYKKMTHDLKTAATNLHVDFHTNVQNMLKDHGTADKVKWVTPGFASLSGRPVTGSVAPAP